MSWWIFMGAVGIVLLLTMASASYETMRAARIDPVKYIRDE